MVVAENDAGRQGLEELRLLEVLTGEDLGAVDAMAVYLDDLKYGERWCGCSL